MRRSWYILTLRLAIPWSALSFVACGASHSFDADNEQMAGVPSAWEVEVRSLPGVLYQWAKVELDDPYAAGALRWRHDPVLAVPVSEPFERFVGAQKYTSMEILSEVNRPNYREQEIETVEDDGSRHRLLTAAWTNAEGTTVVAFGCPVGECDDYGGLRPRLQAINQGRPVRDPDGRPSRSDNPEAVRAEVTVEGRKYSLTEGMLGNLLNVAEILAGTPMTADEAERIRAGAMVEFRELPEAALNGYRAMAELFAEYDGADPVSRAQTRLRMYSAFHDYAVRHDYSSEFHEFLDRHNPVVAWDAPSRRVVTQRAVDAMVASNRFAAELVGQPLPAAKGPAGFAELLPHFAEQSAEVRELLILGEVHWAGLAGVGLAGADESWVASETAFARQRAEAGTDIASIARDLEARATRGATGDLYLEYMLRKVEYFSGLGLDPYGGYGWQ